MAAPTEATASPSDARAFVTGARGGMGRGDISRLREKRYRVLQRIGRDVMLHRKSLVVLLAGSLALGAAIAAIATAAPAPTPPAAGTPAAGTPAPGAPAPLVILDFKPA